VPTTPPTCVRGPCRTSSTSCPTRRGPTAFYRDRLGFREHRPLLGAGPFLRPAGTPEHHTLFMIQTPPFMQGCEHFTFHMAGPTEVLHVLSRRAGRGPPPVRQQLVLVLHSPASGARGGTAWARGAELVLVASKWSAPGCRPGQHRGRHDADMDLHDDAWTAYARRAPRPAGAYEPADASQLFLAARTPS
jgi:hypothetical protein